MIVKFFKIFIVFCGLTFLDSRSHGALALEACNTDLTKHYGLSGVKFPLKNEMKICKGITGSCCNPEDEIKIYRLWNKFSEPKIRQYANDLMMGFENLLMYHEDIVRIDFRKVRTSYRGPKMIIKKVRMCGKQAGVADNIPAVNRELVVQQNGSKGTVETSKADAPHEEVEKHKSSNPAEKDIASDTKSLLNSSRLLSEEENNSMDDKRSKDFETTQANNREPRKLIGQVDAVTTQDLLLLTERPTCRFVRKATTKDVRFTNHIKRDYCLTTRAKLTEFPIEELRDYLNRIQQEMYRLSSLKKSFYCYLCDVKQQMKIDTTAGSIAFKPEFCKRLVTKYKDYLKFQNVIVPEYIDLILQYLRCFQTSEKEERFPSEWFLPVYIKNIEVMNQCFENANQPDFMTHCRHLCQQYSYTSMTRFFDGNPDLLEHVLMTLMGFFRKLDAGKKLGIESSKFGSSIEGLDADDLLEVGGSLPADFGEFLETYRTGGTFRTTSEFKKGKVQRVRRVRINRGADTSYRKGSGSGSRKLKLVKSSEGNTEPGPNPSQAVFSSGSEDAPSSVYPTKTPISSMRCLKSIFVDDPTSLNPFEVNKMTNFSISPQSFAAFHERRLRQTKKKAEIIQPEIIKDYYSTNDSQLKNFETDVDMDFSDIVEQEDTIRALESHMVIF